MIKSKIKWAALGGLVLSFLSLIVHLFLAKTSADLVHYSAIDSFTEDLNYINTAGPKTKSKSCRDKGRDNVEISYLDLHGFPGVQTWTLGRDSVEISMSRVSTHWKLFCHLSRLKLAGSESGVGRDNMSRRYLDNVVSGAT